jgi:hypothetical protein
MPIPPENWERVKALFEAALDQGAERRSSFLDEHCPDRVLRAEVDRLLSEHDEAGSFLSSPVIGDMFESDAPTQGLSAGGLLAGRYRLVAFHRQGRDGRGLRSPRPRTRKNVTIKNSRQWQLGRDKIMFNEKHHEQT